MRDLASTSIPTTPAAQAPASNAILRPHPWNRDCFSSRVRAEILAGLMFTPGNRLASIFLTRASGRSAQRTPPPRDIAPTADKSASTPRLEKAVIDQLKSMCAARSDSAATVRLGGAEPAVGNTEEPTTTRLRT